MKTMVPGSLAFDIAPASGADVGKVTINAKVGGGARGGGSYALPHALAAWLGLCLKNPAKWMAFVPKTSHSLRVIHAHDDARHSDVLVVEVKGRLWFEIYRTVPVQTEQGTAIARPAEMLGAKIYDVAKKVEETEKAAQVIDSQAALFAGGVPQLLSTDRRIFEEAKKEAHFNPEMRQHGTVRLATLNDKPLLGIPSAKQYAPGLSDHDFLMQRIEDGSMSPAKRARLLKKLQQAPTPKET